MLLLYNLAFGLCNHEDITVVENEDDIIQSPTLPDTMLYPNNARCRWNITVEKEMVIRLNFLSFSLEESNDRVDCNYDALYVYDGPDADSTLLHVYVKQHNSSRITLHIM